MEMMLVLIGGLAIGGAMVWFALSARVREMQQRLTIGNEQLTALRDEKSALAIRCATLQTELEKDQALFAERQATLEAARESFADAFKVISTDALAKNNQSFLELAKASLEAQQAVARGELEKRQQAIGELVAPVKLTLEKFDIQIQSIEKSRVDAYATLTEHGAIDVLVNAAGWGRTEPFIDGKPEFWAKLVALNFIGPMTLTQALLPAMIERKRGKIVNVASDAGRVGSLGETVYAGTKGGLIAFTKSLAREMARYGINVNCVCPGPTDTPLMAAVPDKVKDALIKAIPLRRLGRPEETADAIVFFCGPGCSYVTGQVLSVSGGLTMAG